jgi:hypothetical protein
MCLPKLSSDRRLIILIGKVLKPQINDGKSDRLLNIVLELLRLRKIAIRSEEVK